MLRLTDDIFLLLFPSKIETNLLFHFLDIQTEISKLPRVRQLSESTVERLITEPSQTDASWKHAKQAYRCPLCAKVFPFKSKLQRHVLVHTGIKPYK